MAELLGENSDEWIAMAGRVPEDLVEIIQESPTELSSFLRAVRGMTPEQMRQLQKAVERIKRKGE
jgi:hypothetical protein